MTFLDTAFLKDEEIRLVLEKTVEADPAKDWLPAYHFAICDLAGTKMGACDLRIGHNARVYYGGGIGYRVEEPHRGHHYAGCSLSWRGGMEWSISSSPAARTTGPPGGPANGWAGSCWRSRSCRRTMICAWRMGRRISASTGFIYRKGK